MREVVGLYDTDVGCVNTQKTLESGPDRMVKVIPKVLCASALPRSQQDRVLLIRQLIGVRPGHTKSLI